VPIGFVYKGGNSKYKFIIIIIIIFFSPHFWRQKIPNHCLKKKKLFLAKLRQLKEKPAGTLSV
jgi:hypothetical protein